ncbi:hypothetical protein BgiMline_020724 [Biomphalaria glabrata]|nr:hypothetical protein; partial [Biomphalaria glabrata]
MPDSKSTDVTDLAEDGPQAGRCMMHVGERHSHLEADRSKTIISTRTTTSNSTWKGVCMRLRSQCKFNFTILRVTESRWTGSGQKRLTTRELLLFSGYEQ